MASHLMTRRKHAASSSSDAHPPVLQSWKKPPFPVLDALVWNGLQRAVVCVCLLRAVFVMSENLVIYSMFLSPVISHRYNWPTWQPSDKGAMFNHYAS